MNGQISVCAIRYGLSEAFAARQACQQHRRLSGRSQAELDAINARVAFVHPYARRRAAENNARSRHTAGDTKQRSGMGERCVQLLNIVAAAHHQAGKSAAAIENAGQRFSDGLTAAAEAAMSKRTARY